MFFKTVVLIDREEKVETLERNWMSSNLQYEGIQKILNIIGTSNIKERKVTDEKINNDWKRLASLQVGLN